MGFDMALHFTCDHCGKDRVVSLGRPDIIRNYIHDFHTTDPLSPFAFGHKYEIVMGQRIIDTDSLELSGAYLTFNGKDHYLCEDCYKKFDSIVAKRPGIIKAMKDCNSKGLSAKQAFDNLVDDFFFNNGED